MALASSFGEEYVVVKEKKQKAIEFDSQDLDIQDSQRI